MLIEIDTDTLKKLKLSANQLICLKLLLEEDQKLYQKFIAVSPMTEAEIEDLINKKYVTKENDKLIVTEKFINLIETKNSFDEFYDMYPVYVLRSDGSKDYLRTDLRRCRTMYKKLVGKSIARHKHIIECLKAEIQYKINTGNLMFMKRMPKWLASDDWQIGEQILADIKQNEKGDDAYGNTIE